MTQMAYVVLIFLGLLAMSAFINLAAWYCIVKILGIAPQ